MGLRYSGRWCLEKIAGALLGVSRKLYTSSHEHQVALWYASDCETTLRFDYPLTPHSVVFDLGGFRGQWASDIFGRFGCLVHVFEPVPSFAQKIRWRFEHNPRIIIHEFGLSDKDEEARISLSDDATSLYRTGLKDIQIRLRRAADIFGQLKIDTVDLMKINIEGSEYDLLNHLIDTGWIERIRDIQVQFHECVPDATARMEQIQRRLEVTHERTYSYKFVWENWRKR